MSTWFRILVSGLISGGITFGTALQAATQDGLLPTKGVLIAAGIGGGLAVLNDIKSRITPTKSESNGSRA